MLSYHRFQTPEEVKEIVVYPYLLKDYNHRWFLYCQAETGKKLLCYSLDRVNRVEPLPSHKYADFKGDINDMLEEIVGVTYQYGTPILHIIIWVSEVSMDYVLTKPIHVSQRRITGEGEEPVAQEVLPEWRNVLQPRLQRQLRTGARTDFLWKRTCRATPNGACRIRFGIKLWV